MRGDEKNKGKSAKGFSASAATGAVALVFLIIGFQAALFIHRAAVISIIDRGDRPDTVYVSVKDTSVLSKKVSGPPEAASVYVSKAFRRTESFCFDPNTVSSEDLVRLGFSEKQAASIVNYRQKGGRFRRKSDFARSYVVSDSVYKRLEPFIEIPRVDLNEADSAAFDALPGIGGYFASKMIEYRKSLGGSYSFCEQLMDIWNFDKEKYDGLADLIEIDTSSVKPYRLWSLPEDSLRLHPYIGVYAARGIVVFRENNPVSEWSVDALDRAGILKDGMAGKLSRCIIARPLRDSE